MRLPFSIFAWLPMRVLPFAAGVGLLMAEEPSIEGISDAVVIDSQEVDMGDRSVIYNRIETPELKPQETVHQLAVGGSGDVAGATDREFVEMQVTVIVHPGNFSDVRWHREGGEAAIWSNVDFTHFQSLDAIEIGRVVYELRILSADRIGNDADGDFEMDVARPPPELPSLGAGEPRWVASGGLSTKEREFIDFLHRYYETHGAELARESREIEQERAMREAEAAREREEAKKRDTVINYFPIVEEDAP